MSKIICTNENIKKQIAIEIKKNKDKANFSHFDMSLVTDLSNLLVGVDWDGDISTLDTSKIENIDNMFEKSSFKNTSFEKLIFPNLKSAVDPFKNTEYKGGLSNLREFYANQMVLNDLTKIQNLILKMKNTPKDIESIKNKLEMVMLNTIKAYTSSHKDFRCLETVNMVDACYESSKDNSKHLEAEFTTKENFFELLTPKNVAKEFESSVKKLLGNEFFHNTYNRDNSAIIKEIYVTETFLPKIRMCIDNQDIDRNELKNEIKNLDIQLLKVLFGVVLKNTDIKIDNNLKDVVGDEFHSGLVKVINLTEKKYKNIESLESKEEHQEKLRQEFSSVSEHARRLHSGKSANCNFSKEDLTFSAQVLKAVQDTANSVKKLNAEKSNNDIFVEDVKSQEKEKVSNQRKSRKQNKDEISGRE